MPTSKNRIDLTQSEITLECKFEPGEHSKELATEGPHGYCEL